MKIYSIEEEEFVEKINLGGGKKGNYNLNCNDVVWSPIDDQLIATGATNGAVVLWNLGITGKSKQEKVFEDHKRTINKVRQKKSMKSTDKLKFKIHASCNF